MAERLMPPSKITAWLDCTHFLTLQHEVEPGTRMLERSPFGEMAQMLLDTGLEHERTVLDRYRADGPDGVQRQRTTVARVLPAVGRSGRLYYAAGARIDTIVKAVMLDVECP